MGLVHRITIFLSPECMYVLYFTLIRSKVEYTSALWDSVTPADANKLESKEHNFAAVCFDRFPCQLYLRLCSRVFKISRTNYGRYQDAAFIFHLHLASEACSLMETFDLRLLARCIRDFASFNICFLSKTCSFATCASAAKVVSKDANIFGTKTVFLTFYNYIFYTLKY